MSKKHQKVLDAIFSDHVSGNLHWKEIESLLSHLGAEFHQPRGARVVIHLNDSELTLHRPRHGAAVNKTELHALRNFLTDNGIDPSDG